MSASVNHLFNLLVQQTFPPAGVSSTEASRFKRTFDEVASTMPYVLDKVFVKVLQNGTAQVVNTFNRLLKDLTLNQLFASRIGPGDAKSTLLALTLHVEQLQGTHVGYVEGLKEHLAAHLGVPASTIEYSPAFVSAERAYELMPSQLLQTCCQAVADMEYGIKNPSNRNRYAAQADGDAVTTVVREHLCFVRVDHTAAGALTRHELLVQIGKPRSSDLGVSNIICSSPEGDMSVGIRITLKRAQSPWLATRTALYSASLYPLMVACFSAMKGLGPGGRVLTATSSDEIGSVLSGALFHAVFVPGPVMPQLRLLLLDAKTLEVRGGVRCREVPQHAALMQLIWSVFGRALTHTRISMTPPSDDLVDGPAYFWNPKTEAWVVPPFSVLLDI